MGATESYTETFVELIRRASTELPADVLEALEEGRKAEQADGLAAIALDTILNNVDLARESSAPICQDTGTPVVWIHHPVGVSTRALQDDFTAAVREATSRRYLRPNAVDTLTGSNTGDGAGRGIPFLHFEEWDEPRVEVRMILKGGGSENVGAQYKLPDAKLGAGRDLDGARRAVLDAVVDAQGKGCAPGVLGVCVGGDRVSAFEDVEAPAAASAQGHQPDSGARRARGAAAQGGQRTRSRPDGFWRGDDPAGGQDRRARPSAGVLLRDRILHVLGRSQGRCQHRPGGRRDMAELKLPVSEESIRNLKVGDFVELTGRMITGRDAAHTWLIEDHREDVAPYLEDTVIYHCGPVVAENEDGSYDFVAAGPTTSIREEPYQADVIGRYGLRGVIGKGGMGAKTLAGLAEHGAVYLHAVGGAAQVLARAIPRVERVFMLDGIRSARGAVGDRGRALPGHGDHGLAWRFAPRRGGGTLAGEAEGAAGIRGIADLTVPGETKLTKW